MPGSPDRSNVLGPVGIESRKLWRIASSDSRPMTSPAKGAPASVDARILGIAGPNIADPSRPEPCTGRVQPEARDRHGPLVDAALRVASMEALVGEF